MHKKLELFGKSTHTTMLNPNLSSENCGKKIQSDRPKKWSKITILSPITFWENSRSWSWSDLRSLFEQVILMWSKIAKKVIGHYFGLPKSGGSVDPPDPLPTRALQSHPAIPYCTIYSIFSWIVPVCEANQRKHYFDLLRAPPTPEKETTAWWQLKSNQRIKCGIRVKKIRKHFFL